MKPARKLFAPLLGLGISLRGSIPRMLQSLTSRWSDFSLRTRLYAIIAVLGLLPIAGGVIAKAAIDNSMRDIVALDRAARGSIYLERVNGLEHAVVMESRSICMSKDWTAAEPFAQNLFAKLIELQKVVRTWKAEAITSQYANIDELAVQVDNLVRFQTELVRFARVQDPTAARMFGDNDANRQNRSALNEALTAVTRGYEQEITRARSQIESNEHSFLAVSSMLASLSALALCGGLMLVKYGLVTPLLEMRDLMLRLAQGQLDIKVSDQQRSDELGEMGRAVQVFHASLVERQKLNNETRLLSELNKWLQSCKSLNELYEIVAKFLTRLLPNCAGNLYIYANSRDILDSVTFWNGGRLAPPMQPDDCWSLRRGYTVTHRECDINFHCAHVDSSTSDDYCCIPILAYGETIGLLHLEFGVGHQFNDETLRKEAMTEQRRLGMICAEQISMAIANVKLRDQLRDQSIRDTLTGLFNRRYLLETCRREFSRAMRAGQCVSILSIDVDHFKKCNDNHGHDAGDTVLRAFGECLESSFRDGDIACRFGGEEFVVVLPGSTPDFAARRAEEFRLKVESLAIRYLNRNLPGITISIGVAAFPESGDNPQAVINAADEALYRAKQNGRNRIELSSSIINFSSGVSAGHSLALQYPCAGGRLA
jgi:diguanylate cyclase (GGDEF)-like protein